MAFFFTVLFIATAYITPEVLFGDLAQLRMEVIVAFFAVATSLPNLVKSRLNEAPQTYAFIGFCIAVPMSIAVGGWMGGAADVLYGLMPLVLCFVLPAANFRNRQQLQWLTLAMLLCSAYFIFMGLQDLHNHVVPSKFIYGDGELRRIRGLGFVFDPNDLAQVLVSLIPLVFLWKSRSWFLNIFLLGIPITLLVTGMFFTHSRGGALALMATIVIALRRKIGTVPALVLAGGLFAASLAVGWSGGRDVSMEAGGDRLDAWSTGLEFIKTHPLFGVGVGQFAQFNDITAHNSIVVCAAEIGLPGFVCWVFMIVASLRRLIAVSSARPEQQETAGAPAQVPFGAPLAHLRSRVASAGLASAHTQPLAMAGSASLAAPTLSEGAGRSRFGRSQVQAPVIDLDRQEDIRRMARLLVCSLTGFLTAGWFLSRALSMWLFLYFGIAQAIFCMAEDAGMKPRRDSFPVLLRWSGVVAVGLLVFVYGLLRFRTMTGR